MSIKPWVRASAMRGIVNYVIEQGLDPHEVVGAEAIQLADVSDPYRKIDLGTVMASFERIAQATGREDVGLELGLSQSLEDWGPFGFLFRNSPNAMEALKQLCRCSVALQNHANFGLKSSDTLITLEYSSNHSEFSGWELDAETTVTFVMSIVNGIYERPVVPAAISFVHSPLVQLKHYKHWLGCMPQFDSAAISLSYRRSVLETANPHAQPELYQVLLHHIEAMAADEKEEEQLLNFVRNNIGRGLTAGTATLEHIAAEIGLESRTLQRRLRTEGKSFQELVDEVRLARAIYFLRRTRMAITDIALELGYAEASVFVRGFKRLTGTTPHQYRKKVERALPS